MYRIVDISPYYEYFRMNPKYITVEHSIRSHFRQNPGATFYWAAANDSSYIFLINLETEIGFLCIPAAHPLCGYAGQSLQSYEIPTPRNKSLWGRWTADIQALAGYGFPIQEYPWCFRVASNNIGYEPLLEGLLKRLFVLATALDDDKFVNHFKSV